MREPVEWPTRDLLSHRAAATPDRTALVDTDSNREWTYRALDTIVDDVTTRLQHSTDTDSGDQAGESRVALLASTRVGFVAVLHAALRAGHAVIPLDTRLAVEELGNRIDRTDPDLVVCERDTEAAAVEATDTPVASLDAPVSQSVCSLQPADKAPASGVEPAEWERDDTAILMFTSGTTGQPKAVRLTLGNLVASATASAFRLGVAPGDRWLCCLPMFHMGGLAPAIRSPLYGTTLALQREFDAQATARTLGEFDITGVSLVPTQLKRLLDTGWTPGDALESVLLGGAPATRELIDRALAEGVPVYPTYGMTETASQIATATPRTARNHPDSVGQPLLFTEVTVVDEHRNPVSSGETGELVVDGPTVSPGYLDTDRTRRHFDDLGLHTGDIGYRDEDGRLWVLGRADDTIVTGGENVHPTEVTSALREHSEVDEVAVVGISDEEWGERIAALVVPQSVPVAELEAFLSDRLAGYKIPKTIEAADTLPRTSSGTVDREAVRDHLRE
jgi:O-succinylbenzoic acid--CoA ligase